MPFTLLSLLAGSRGIPWCPIYTTRSVYNNSRGGKDVTEAVVSSLRRRLGTEGLSLAAFVREAVPRFSRGPRSRQ